MPGYELLASPTLYPGQTVRTRLLADAANAVPVRGQLYLRAYGPNDELVRLDGPAAELPPGADVQLAWPLTDQGMPIAEVGVAVHGEHGASGTLYLDWLTWDGTPRMALDRPDGGGEMWRRAWVNGVDVFDSREAMPYRVMQNTGTGLLIHGAREWADYQVQAAITPYFGVTGLAARVQGLERYYALLLGAGGTVQLVKALDGTQVLFEAELGWQLNETYTLRLAAEGTTLRAWVGDQQICAIEDTTRPLEGGGIALICQAGSLAASGVRIAPLD